MVVAIAAAIVARERAVKYPILACSNDEGFFDTKNEFIRGLFTDKIGTYSEKLKNEEIRKKRAVEEEKTIEHKK